MYTTIRWPLILLFALANRHLFAQLPSQSVGPPSPPTASAASVNRLESSSESRSLDKVPGPCASRAPSSKPNPCAKSHKPLFYDNNFEYLNDSGQSPCCLGDVLKQLDVGCCGKLDLGGQYRMRYHHEVGMKGAERFLDTTDDFLLNRLRLYTNYAYGDWTRLYVEGIFADSSGQDFPTRPIDTNYGDLLNAFVDVKLLENSTLRIGRQELLYGAQRTVSPLDWANTRRTFEGVKLMLTQDDWVVDVFWTNFVPVIDTEFDEADYAQRFYGVYATYSCDQDIFELYYLGYDNQDSLFSLHTFGSRIYANRGNWLYELEGAWQGGDAAGVGRRQDDGFITVGIGRPLKSLSWDPVLWLYLDYASSDYNQLFPLAHKYLGFIDAVQRTNIKSVNALFTAKPTDKLSLLLWFYVFQSNDDGPVPSIGGTPSQNASRNLGQELDLILGYKIRPRSDILFGYSHFWRGSKINNPHDADFFYTQWTVNF